jgi:iron complex transport system ATP-binding protein
MIAPRLRALDVTYQVGHRRLVDGVSLDLRPGEVLALVGPNGAGKSTLLKILSGDLAPSAGRVFLDGLPLDGYRVRPLALKRAVLPQQSLLQFAFTAWEVVAMGRSPHLRFGGETAHDAAVVEAAMARTDTLNLAQRSFPTLSGGEGQRVTLARVLAQETPVLLLDEPTASLDIHHQELVANLARAAAADGGAVLIVLHDLNLAARCADRVVVLQEGHLVGIGAPWEILTADRLSAVFAHPIAVMRHPVEDCPLIVPLPCSAPDQQTQQIGQVQARTEPCLSR